MEAFAKRAVAISTETLHGHCCSLLICRMRSVMMPPSGLQNSVMLSHTSLKGLTIVRGMQEFHRHCWPDISLHFPMSFARQLGSGLRAALINGLAVALASGLAVTLESDPKVGLGNVLGEQSDQMVSIL